MTKVLVVIGLLFLFGWAGEAGAISAGCLSGGFPATPGPDAVGRSFAWFDELFRGDVWRVACADDPNQVAILFRVVPQGSSPFVCSASFDIIQGGQQIGPILRQTPSSSSFCNDLLVPTTFVLERQSGPPFDPKGAFTLAHDSDIVRTLEVPAGGGAPTLNITVVSTGCNACLVGQLAQFHIHVANPGPPILVELKTAFHFPDGSTGTILGRHVEDILESGEFDIPLLGIIVPPEAPKGQYVIEAAVIHPDTGVTLARSTQNGNVQ
jgi:hypothetical protein